MLEFPAALVPYRKKLEEFFASSWQSKFPSQTVGRGTKYFKDGLVLSLVGYSSNSWAGITGVISNGRQSKYIATIDFHPAKSQIICDCNCPVGYLCKHAFATLLAVESLLNIEEKDPLEEWLEQLDKVSKKSSLVEDPSSRKSHFRLIFLLSSDPTKTLKLSIAKQKVLKDGSTLIEKKKLPFLSYNHPVYYGEEGSRLVKELCEVYYSYLSYDNEISLEGILGGAFLHKILKTQQAYILNRGKVKVPLILGEKSEIEFGWKKDVKEFLQPKVHIVGRPKAKIFTQDPPLYLDSETNEIGSIKGLEELEPRLVELWSNSIQIPVEKISQIRETVVKSHLPIEIPEESGLEILTEIKPDTTLRISRKELYPDNETNHKTSPSPILGELRFNYKGHETEATFFTRPQNKALFVKNAKGHPIKILRDRDLELKCHQALETHCKLFPVGEHFNSRTVLPKSANLYTPADNQRESEAKWGALLTNGLQPLEELGIQIQLDDTVQIIEIGEDAFYEEIEEAKMDWFRFDTGYINKDGKQQSLLPFLAEFLKHANLETLPDLRDIEKGETVTLAYPEEGSFYNFPAKKFYSLVKNLRELFGSNLSETKEIHRLQAATLAENLDIDGSETLHNLKKLGKALKNFKGLPPAKISKKLKAELRAYQIQGLQWMQFLARHSLNGILADDMGLGKTLQSLALILSEIEAGNNDKRPSLIIAPTSVVHNWLNEVQKFTPTLKAQVLQGKERRKHFLHLDKFDIIITSYALLLRDAEVYKEKKFHFLILDEAQYIKNPKAKITQELLKLQNAHRICLSGTPVENHLGELWSLMNFLMPSYLGNITQFKKDFRTPIEKAQDTQRQQILNNRVAPLLLRRTKDQVATELPPKTEIVHPITLNSKQIDLYETVRVSMDKQVRDALKDKGLSRSQIIVLDALLKLRQVCCHPQLLSLTTAKKIEESAKLDYLTKELLPTLLEEGRSILLFSQFTKMLALIEKHLKKESISYVKITGRTKDRTTPVAQFQAGKASLFLISLKAGGTGLNLTAADTVIHYDPWWNPAVENQATDRAYRIGQDKPVFVHKLICSGSIEERILELQQKKSSLVKSLLSEKTTKLQIDQSTLNNLLAPLDNY